MQVNNATEHSDIPQPRSTGLTLRLAEAALLERACRGDVGAFDALVRRTQKKLFQVALSHVRNRSDAQEVLQDAYFAAWRSLPTFEGRAQFSSWIYRITVNCALMYLRARNRHRAVAIDHLESAESNAALVEAMQGARSSALGARPDHDYESAELRAHVAAVVSLLPPLLQATVVLRDLLEMSTKDAASELGVSLPATKTRLHRAHRALRESLVSYVTC